MILAILGSVLSHRPRNLLESGCGMMKVNACVLLLTMRVLIILTSKVISLFTQPNLALTNSLNWSNKYSITVK